MHNSWDTQRNKAFHKFSTINHQILEALENINASK